MLNLVRCKPPKFISDDGTLIEITCPFCHLAFEAPAKYNFFTHQCKSLSHSPVYFINGFALAGVSSYAKAEREEINKRKGKD